MVVLIVAALAVVGCSSAYNGERLFWKAQQREAAILRNPEKATPEQVQAAIQAFETVITKTPGTTWAAQSHLAIAGLHVVRKEYSQARDLYNSILENFNQYRDICLIARAAIAKTYEAEENWDSAIRMYQEISDYHAWNRAGLEAPLYIASIYEKRHQDPLATKAYDHAIRTYLKLLPEAASPDAANRVKGYMALAYQRVGRWDKAVDILEELNHAEAGINRPMVLLTLASIYQAKLGDIPRARQAYAKLAQDYPDHQFAKIAKAQLEYLTQPVQQPVATDLPTPVNQQAPTPVAPTQGR